MTEAELATEVRNAFVYSDDGKLIWQNPPKQHAQLRLKVAGRKEPKGYVAIQFQGKRYRRHRLVWLYHYGYWPKPVCDHINRVRNDDRIENLRELTAADNARNNTRCNITARYGGKNYQVRRGQRQIGTFNTLKEAEEAYDRAKNSELSILGR